MYLTLKALSALLSYPGADLQAARYEIARALLTDRRLTSGLRHDLLPLLDALGNDDLLDLQEGFVGLFDRSRSLSLNLFEHVHGESRARGSAMVDLVETYRAAGFEPATEELPDHLPVLLEFLAHRPEAEARETLADAAHIFEVLAQRLEKRDSPYAGVFRALLHLAGETADAATVETLLAQPEDDPDDLEALDAVWAETQVTFGPDPNAGCPQVRDMLARMDNPTNPAPAVPAAAE
ncbi:nitrate reductase molybdenum cofactor assembly chaperone [Rhodovulum adriaticum]|uniref:Respiratory nitrate reductase chaperone NarJ n=1 Tax=Rhodovulum adriaticum TaxID=35804 RepID=A0A4R2P1Q3_RHOAD|nr:nitrate reductase molybdenum cofactor assembly chaperone [Rhodovulum adriaticum]MBK1634829.1 nitrate reductase molybdenum cofactor assembly chaperone [Rhodovulum adriaticum]TCP27595.1 respiratory nitrate reductase chaperone NarJ [Rhodovulum adriaticum]